MINTIELNHGEFAGIGIIEIVSIPTNTILKENYINETDIENEYRQGFSNLLVELYQSYQMFRIQNENSEISAEILWITEPVSHQPFEAKINMYMILRSIGADKQAAISMVKRLLNLVTLC